MLGASFTSDLKAIFTQNLIKDNHVVVNDVDLAIEIFGEDIENIKDKTVKKKPNTVINDMIDLPSEF